MLVSYVIHKVASSYQSKRRIEVHMLVWKVLNKPFFQNLSLHDFHKDTGRQEMMDIEILVGKKRNHDLNTVNNCSNFTEATYKYTIDSFDNFGQSLY